jgi:GNAT superfamily N-acetyltransferase
MNKISIRYAHLKDCPALGQILVAATRHAFRGRVPERCLAWTAEESAANWARNFKSPHTFVDGQFLFVAETPTRVVVGFALLTERVGDEVIQSARRYPHELRVLQIDPLWQRRGIGRQLVSRVARRVLAEGGSRLLVRVLAENPNHAFYRRLGAAPLGTEPYVWEGYQTEQVVYGWETLP